ncbi:MAG: metallophosphoesterase [Pyrinomonadaceae bacterium]
MSFGAAPQNPVRYASSLLGDAGTGGKDQQAIVHRIAIFRTERLFDTVLLLGDNIYPNGRASDLPKKFERPYAKLLRRGVLFYAALGNHDVREGRKAQINYKLFNMGGRSYYSFSKGEKLIEFFVLDSTNLDNEQLRWLEGALEKSTARWKIASFSPSHLLLRKASRFHQKAAGAARDRSSCDHGVAAVFSEHDHFYERTLPQQGIQYFVSGAGGKVRRGNINRCSPFFVAGNDDTNSFIYAEAAEDQLSFWAVDEIGSVFDSGTIAPAT